MSVVSSNDTAVLEQVLARLEPSAWSVNKSATLPDGSILGSAKIWLGRPRLSIRFHALSDIHGELEKVLNSPSEATTYVSIYIDADMVTTSKGEIWPAEVVLDGKPVKSLTSDPSMWHRELAETLDPAVVEKLDARGQRLPGWFDTYVIGKGGAKLERRAARPQNDLLPYAWIGYAVRFTHPQSGTMSVPIQLLVANERISDKVLSVFRHSFPTPARPYLLLCNDEEFYEEGAVQFTLAAPNYDGDTGTIIWGDAIDLPGWFAEHAPSVFKGHVETVTVAENDLTPTHDAPDPEPKLGFDIIAMELHRTMETVRRQAAEAGVDTSITIGLFGPWGSGKSTLMKALEGRLRRSGADGIDAPFDEGRFTYDIVPVNAWKWESSKSLSAQMLSAVLAVMGPRLEKHARERGLREAWFARFLKWSETRLLPNLPVLLVAIFIIALLFSSGLVDWGLRLFQGVESQEGNSAQSGSFALIITVVSGIGASVLRFFQDAVKNWLNRLFQKEVVKVTDHERLEQTYAEIKRAAEKGNSTLAFFIDDLDRCTPERVAEFVESIHKLTAAGCVTIVACDEDYVSAALNARYASIVEFHPDGPGFGRGFLEKIVQVGFRMPALTETGVREAGLIASTGATTQSSAPSANSADVQATPAAMTSDHAETVEPVDDTATEETEASPTPPERQIDAKLLSETLDEMVRDFVQPMGINMRRVKALRNTVGLYLRIAVGRGDLGPEDHDGAAQLSAFLVSDLLDRVWLDAYRLDQLDAYESHRGLGPLSGRQALQDVLKAALGPPDELDPLYRLLGRNPRALPPIPE